MNIGESNRVYVESSHANNTGLAKFINDSLYDTKTPSQLDNLMSYIYGEQISKIPPKLYNDDKELSSINTF